MRIPEAERQELLRLPRVGERVVGRLERAGIDTLERLAASSLHEVMTELIQQPRERSLDGGIWARSSLARSAVMAVLRYAKTQVPAGPRRVPSASHASRDPRDPRDPRDINVL